MSEFIVPSKVLENPVAKELADLGVIDPSEIELYYPHVRDREDVAVFRCQKSGVIFLNRNDHLDDSYYENFEGTSYWNTGSGVADVKQMDEDDERRVRSLRTIIAKHKFAPVAYLDVGCGQGAVLSSLTDIPDRSGVELQEDTRVHLESSGLTMYPSVAAAHAAGKQFDIVTLFHVFEHLTEPLETLKQVHTLVKPGGVLIMEVPHARDVLFQTFDLDAFKKFAFWSEHIILHTQDSLRAYVEAAGFSDVAVEGIQRYPVSNHLHWLWKGEPGGHRKLLSFREEHFENAYAKLLTSLDQTDTLWVVARA